MVIGDVGALAAAMDEAKALLGQVRHPGTATRFYRDARAAFARGDYAETISCCEAAIEAGSPERWT